MKNVWSLFSVWLVFPVSWRALVILGLTTGISCIIFFLPSVAQDISYHDFADQRKILGVPNFFNVISNAILAIVGILGLLFVLNNRVRKSGNSFTNVWENSAFLVFFLGIVLTAFGSAYYHLAPDNPGLFWDRLPMAIVFMSFLTIAIGERISLKAARWLLLPLLTLGIGSVLYWRFTEIGGAGDLRPYIFIQFFPLLVIPLMLFLFSAKYTRTADIFIVLGWYGLAKVFEILDAQIFTIGNFLLSGHTLKHLTSALAVYWIFRMLKLRRPLSD